MKNDIASEQQQQQQKLQTPMIPRSPPLSSLLTPRQLSSLRALTSTFIPSLPPPPPPSSTSFQNQTPPSSNPPPHNSQTTYWTHDLSQNTSYLTTVAITINAKLSPRERFELKTLLFLLSTTLGTILLCLCLAITPFTQWNVEDKTKVLCQWQRSRWIVKRQIVNGLKRLLCGLAYSFVDDDDDDDSSADDDQKMNGSSSSSSSNPYWEGMGYPGPYWRTVSKEEDERLLKRVREDTQCFSSPSNDNNTNKTPFLSTDDPHQSWSFDAIVIGSGAGGGVAFHTLSTSGLSTLLIEKGDYVPPESLSQYESHAMDALYEKSGLLTTTDGHIGLLAGATVGGGTTINWACCLDLPEHVREEWADRWGLNDFRPGDDDDDEEEEEKTTISAFDEALEKVKRKIGVTIPPSDGGASNDDDDEDPHNNPNRILRDGCHKLKYAWRSTGQNLRQISCDAAGYTCLGDRYGNKQGTMMTYIADAVNQTTSSSNNNNNANILTNCFVQRIIYDKKRATGVIVRCQRTQRLFTITAQKCLIISAGSLHTPCLLQRSSINNNNPHIGSHLHLHPVITAMGVFSRDIHLYRGPPMTGVCNEFARGIQNDGYGCKLECPAAHTGIVAATLPWTDGLSFKHLMKEAKDTSAIIVLQRDRSDEGRVWWDERSRSPCIKYEVGCEDGENMVVGLKAAIRILACMGARKVLTSHVGVAELDLSDDNMTDEERDTRVERYLCEEIDRKFTFEKHKLSIFCAHQMGSCRMGVNESTSVVDCDGRVWGFDNLYVMDASVFPTASGSNPMMTTLAISQMLSERLVNRIRGEETEEEKGVEGSSRREEENETMGLRRRHVS